MATDKEAFDAIRLVIGYLDSDWIEPSCREDPMIGCRSCEAIELERKLQAFAKEIEENLPSSLANLTADATLTPISR